MQDTPYSGCLEKMFRLHRFGIKLGLETISAMLSALGNPEQRFHCIHIAGTNGKGSVAATLSAILIAAGCRVGRYTSPHLERFNERICVDDEPITDAQVVASCDRVFGIGDLPRQPTFFEFTTAMALDQFARHAVQWAVIETGMGGRLDATNVVRPAMAIITNISLEHRAYLGNTLAVIAGEKAGIIKPGVPVVSGADQRSVREVIQRRAHDQNAPLFRKGRDFRGRRHGPDAFDYYGLDNVWRDLRPALAGAHQVSNASLALAACELLARRGMLPLTEATVRQGLANTRWPGRLEVAATDPHVLLDGAHNLMAARILRRHLKSRFADRDITLVVGILDDKPYRSILKDLAPLCRRVIVTQPKIDRAMSAHDLARVASEFCHSVEVIEDVGDAVRHAIATAPKTDVICIAGSLYVVGEAKTALARYRS